MKAFTYLLGRQWFSKVLNYIQIQSTVTGLHILMSELRPYIFDGPSSNDWPQNEKETNFVLLLFMTCFLLPSYLSFTLLFLFSIYLLHTHIHMNTFFFKDSFLARSSSYVIKDGFLTLFIKTQRVHGFQQLKMCNCSPKLSLSIITILSPFELIRK